MKTKTVLIILVVVLVAVGVYGLYDAPSQEGQETQQQTRQEQQVQQEQKDTLGQVTPAATTGSYELYSTNKLARANTGEVVLFFKASWCPTCRAVDADIKANLGNIPPSLTILEVDYDNSADLKKKYNVIYQHTFVKVDVDGTMIKKWSGSPTLDSIITQAGSSI